MLAPGVPLSGARPPGLCCRQAPRVAKYHVGSVPYHGLSVLCSACFVPPAPMRRRPRPQPQPMTISRPVEPLLGNSRFCPSFGGEVACSGAGVVEGFHSIASTFMVFGAKPTKLREMCLCVVDATLVQNGCLRIKFYLTASQPVVAAAAWTCLHA